jgi:hypothetical protein
MKGYVQIFLFVLWTTIVFGTGFYVEHEFNLAKQAAADNAEIEAAHAAAIKANNRATELESTLSTYQVANQNLQEKLHAKVSPANNCALSLDQLSALHTYSVSTTTRR